ncbi:MAG: acyl-CoA/acyl-ACP dehydrogenase [Verrucomicrobiae bacterium]|nr:acyl-CoA/acyl-ACP dehydrogenase [Verrucomicrobiae bacterium]
METKSAAVEKETLGTLPNDDIRQIMWRFADRYDLQMLVQSARSVARGPVARLVAEGARNSHDWTEQKASLLKVFDESGVTAAFMEPEHGGFIEGPKNLALALVAFELAWVDGGSATSSLAGNLALAPIHERGTDEQRARYMSLAAPAKEGEKRVPLRGAFALTEPLPYVGVETGILCGKVSVADWKDGNDPLLLVEKRGRFITNMGFADFVTAAVDTADKRIKSSCMIILEKGDPGTYDRGAPTKKLVHQLSSTNDPVLSLKVPASRIIGGYTIKDGVIVPKFSHGEVIEAVFRRTRVTVGLMTSAKLLSAVEPVIRYARNRFRGGEAATPGTPRYDFGIQQKEDVQHRLIDVWSAGEAGASLGFAAARLFDELDPLERKKEAYFIEKGITGGRAQFKEFKRVEKDVLEYIQLSGLPADKRDNQRIEQLQTNVLVQFLVADSAANVLCPACKLWNTGFGATVMREAVSMMGGYGITEDCPGFLGHKWMDAQLEATYEGPEAVQRRQMSVTMTNEIFLAQYRQWVTEMRHVAATHPGSGACALATAMELWLWTLDYLQKGTDGNGNKLYTSSRQGVSFSMADALCWLLAARCLILDALELEKKGPGNAVVAEGLKGTLNFYFDLCHVQCARSAGEVGRVCAELVFGYNAHPAWSGGGACCQEKMGAVEKLVFGEECCSDAKAGGTKEKAGPCVHFAGYEEFVRRRIKLDGCLTGARLAKDRAGGALLKIMIPEVQDYPV